MGIGAYIQTAWNMCIQGWFLTALFLIFNIFVGIFYLSFDVLWTTNLELSSASVFIAEDIFLLIQHTCNRHFQLQLLHLEFTYLSCPFAMSIQQPWVCSAIPVACKCTPSEHLCSQAPEPCTAVERKAFSMQLKGLWWPQPCFLLIPLYFLDLLITEGVAYWWGIKEGSNTHAD